MIGALAFSGFLALSLAPMLCSKLLRHENRGRLRRRFDDRFGRLEEGYARRARPGDQEAAGPARVAGLFLAGAGALFFTLQSELVPQEDAGILNAQLSAPEGTGFER
jgi:multidrug efflux pump